MVEIYNSVPTLSNIYHNLIIPKKAQENMIPQKEVADSVMQDIITQKEELKNRKNIKLI